MPSGIRVAVPAASSRIRHRARWPAGSVDHGASGRRRRARHQLPRRARVPRPGVAPPVSTNSQAPPARQRRRAAGHAGRRPCPRRSAGGAAAGRPRPPRRRPRRGSRGRRAPARRGASTSRTVASVSTPRVPSLPVRARATSPPCSGSRRVQGVAGDPARQFGEAGAQQRQLAVDQRRRSPSAGAGPVAGRRAQPLAAVGQRRPAPARCRRWCPRPPSASRTSCCRSCRRGCSGCGWTGRGRSVSPCGAAASWSRSSTTPGWTTAVRASGSSATMPVHVAGEVQDHAGAGRLPGDRGPAAARDTGTPCSRHTASAAATSSASRGATTPSGTRR